MHIPRGTVFRHWRRFSGVILMGLAVMPVRAATIDLVREGVPRAVVILPPASESRPEYRGAAGELVNHVKQMSGVELPVFVHDESGHGFHRVQVENARVTPWEDDPWLEDIPGDRLPIRIGAAADAALDDTIRAEAGASDAFAVVVTRHGVQLRGLQPVGAQHAVFDLLEQLGIRWHQPLADGLVIPQRQTLSLEVQQTVRVPAAELRFMAPVTPRATIYTVRMKCEHLEQVRRSPYVRPTPSADADFLIGRSAGWKGSAEAFDQAAHVPPVTNRDGERIVPPEIPPQDLHGYLITDFDTTAPKQRIVLTDGIHTEHTGSWSFHATIDFLLSDDPRAATLRKKAEFHVYPLINPDGRYIFSRVRNPELAAGGWRNALRMWLSAGIFQSSDILGDAMRYDTGGRADYHIDYHSNGTVIYKVRGRGESAFVRAMAAQDPPIQSVGAIRSGVSMPAWAERELNAAHVFQLEHNPWLSLDECLRIGRAYALGLHDAITGNVSGERGPERELSLRAAKPDLDATDLMNAVGNGEPDAVRKLLDEGVEVDEANYAGNTPLHRAAEWNHAAIAVLLLDAGAEPSRANRRSWTPLHYAARYGSVEAARALVEHGAQVNARHDGGDTPLLIAASYGHAEIVDWLLHNGADYGLAGRWHRTPADWAARMGHHEVLGRLRKNNE